MSRESGAEVGDKNEASIKRSVSGRSQAGTSVFQQKAKHLDEVTSAAEPGQPNPKLLSEIRSVLTDASVATRLPEWIKILDAARAEDMPEILAILKKNERYGRFFRDESALLWTRWGHSTGRQH